MNLKVKGFQGRLRLSLNVKEKGFPYRKAENGESLLSMAAVVY